MLITRHDCPLKNVPSTPVLHTDLVKDRVRLLEQDSLPTHSGWGRQPGATESKSACFLLCELHSAFSTFLLVPEPCHFDPFLMWELRKNEVLASGLHFVKAVKSGMDWADSPIQGHTVNQSQSPSLQFFPQTTCLQLLFSLRWEFWDDQYVPRILEVDPTQPVWRSSSWITQDKTGSST